MAAKKGHPKYGGRKKGTSNKVNVEIRSRLKLFIEDNIDKLQKDLDTLQPFQMLQIMLKMFDLVLPKNFNVEMNDVTLRDFIALPVSERTAVLEKIEDEKDN